MADSAAGALAGREGASGLLPAAGGAGGLRGGSLRDSLLGSLVFKSVMGSEAGQATRPQEYELAEGSSNDDGDGPHSFVEDGARAAGSREQQIGGSGGSPETPGPLT
jgi:hypothetical protein